MLDKIFWVVTANKIRLFISNNKILNNIVTFVKNYWIVFGKSSDQWKWYLIIWPVLNIFIFSWFFPFIIIMFSNFIIYNKIK